MEEDRNVELLAKLLERANAGDDDALSSLCTELEPPLHQYFARRFSHPDVVDELCQETFARLLKNLPSVRERMSLRSFVIKIAIHVTQDHFRKKYRRAEEALASEPVAAEDDPAESILKRLDLERALQKLPEQSRRILLMRADGYNYAEISERMELSVSGVKMQVKRNLAKLRSSLGVTIFLLSTTVLLRWSFDMIWSSLP